MAAKYAIRWRPQAYRSTTETIIEGKNPSSTNPQGEPATPSLGSRIKVLQLVVYDDTQITAQNPYRPGHPDTERYLEIADEVVIRLAVDSFAGKTDQQAKAMWDAARDAQRTVWETNNVGLTYGKAAIGSYLSDFVVIG